jgi:Family of unknown function (DUF6325)
MAAEEITEIGPVDYLVVEWSGKQPTGEAAPLLVDLVDQGLIRVLDLAFIEKADDGSVAAVEISHLAEKDEAFKVFDGASSGLLSGDDISAAGEALEPGTSAALLLYENRWAALFAAALRRSGAELVASGRIPFEDVTAALDAAEAKS